MAVFQEQRLRAVQAWFPKLLFLNSMDPMYRFPQSRWLPDLFESVTLPEAMLLCFERMQVCLFEVLLNCGFVRCLVVRCLSCVRTFGLPAQVVYDDQTFWHGEIHEECDFFPSRLSCFRCSC